MRIPLRALATAALLVAALLLAACGSSDETTESTSAAKTPRKGYSGKPDNPGGPQKDKGAPQGANAKKDGGGEDKQRDPRQPEPRKRTSRTGGPSTSPKAETKRPSKCPKALSAKACAEAGQTYEQSGNSRPVPTNECPPSMDAATCEESGKAYEEAESGSREVQPNECPRAMTEEECRQAGEAYAEATK
ncbi:MAG TPA: hypothetical protein VF030_02960 [Solirubrobacterales bacterium]